ncbi:hypothetical protein ID866_8112 [Astraeus odoratus]|nr:hypothetical protein ID866_8112 [Astraeus odoratus]
MKYLLGIRGGRLLTIRWACTLGLTCILAVTLHALTFSIPTAHVEVFSVIDISPFRQQDQDGFHGQPEPLERHTYTSDGLLVVNPNGPHPIFELMRGAEEKWNAKLQRASKTLEEAVAEYKRRYNRPPPLGFDKWWDYVVRHDVLLPDEFDEIYYDLEPYWGFDPLDIQQAQRDLEKQNDIISIEKTPSSDKLEVVFTSLRMDPKPPLRRINNILGLIEEVQHELPPMRISFSPHDGPNMLSDWRIKNMTLEAARNGKTVRKADFPKDRVRGWLEACPPSSPARQNPPDLPPLPPIHFDPQPNTTAPKTFIASHRDTMDPCRHPSLLATHGQFLSQGLGPHPRTTLVPRFSLCRTELHHDIRPPVPYGWVSGDDLESDGDLPWDDKSDERLDWRGSITGLFASPHSSWTFGQRARLVSLTNTVMGNVSILRVPADEHMRVGDPNIVKMGKVNPAWMDIAFAGNAIHCDEAAGTCDEIEEMWEFRQYQDREEEGRHKFIIDVDGNGWSGRFKRLITTNSIIFKSTIYPEWFTSRVAPWLHYVPIQVTYEDLYDAVAFFRMHDDLAARIAREGKEWSKRFWRKEDMGAYLYRLLLEYARVSSTDRDAMTYYGAS